MPALTASRPCPLCGLVATKELFRYSEFQFFTDGLEGHPKQVDVVTVQRCNCGLAFMNPTFTDFGFTTLFGEASKSYGSSEGREIEEFTWINKKLKFNEDSLVLDYGCHDGRLLRLFPKSCKRVGFDVDDEAIATAQALDSSGLYIKDQLSRHSFPGGCTLITMMHVLEHVPHPVELLIELAGLMADRSHLVLECPVLELDYGGDVCGFLSMGHLTHFTRETLRNVVEKSGFEIIAWEEMTSHNGVRLLCSPATGRERQLKASPYRCSYESQRHLFKYYLKAWLKDLEGVKYKLDRLHRFEKIVIWGAGWHTEHLESHFSFLAERGCHDLIFVDTDEEKVGKTYRGYPIFPAEQIRHISWADTALLVSSYASQAEISKLALSLGVPQEAIVTLYNNPRAR